jgi:hypothetical protein
MMPTASAQYSRPGHAFGETKARVQLRTVQAERLDLDESPARTGLVQEVRGSTARSPDREHRALQLSSSWWWAFATFICSVVQIDLLQIIY